MAFLLLLVGLVLIIAGSGWFPGALAAGIVLLVAGVALWVLKIIAVLSIAAAAKAVGGKNGSRFRDL